MYKCGSIQHMRPVTTNTERALIGTSINIWKNNVISIV